MDVVKKLALVVAAAGTLAVQGVALAADGQVNFTGTMQTASCKVANAANGVVTVALGSIATTSFAAVGAKSGEEVFSINLTGCPTGSKVNLRFSGLSDSTNVDLLAIATGTGTATGVAVGLSNDDGSALSLATNSNQVAADATGAATLGFRAYYQSTAATVGAGTASATAFFTLIYN